LDFLDYSILPGNSEKEIIEIWNEDYSNFIKMWMKKLELSHKDESLVFKEFYELIVQGEFGGGLECIKQLQYLSKTFHKNRSNDHLDYFLQWTLDHFAIIFKSSERYRIQFKNQIPNR
jgi:hypothetical protein